MIQYQDKKVTAKVKAKHEVSDYLMDNLTVREQDEVLKHISLFEDRIHKLLGVKFKEINSASNFIKSI